MSQSTVPQTAAAATKHKGWWWKTLIGGALLWVITAVVTLNTGNSNLVPTVILLGSFLVPFTVMMFAAERAQGNLDMTRLTMAFFVGGIFGVLGASILEVRLEPSWYMFLGVGLIEEFCKGAVFVLIGLAVMPKNGYQGAILGATVGAGFAAFESAGYAFNAGLTWRGIDLVSMLETEALRGLLTPVGHVLWTGILGAAIFGVMGKTLKWWSALLAFLAVVVLHGLWDSMVFISAALAIVFTDGAWNQLQHGVLLPTTQSEIVQLQQTLYVAGLVIISAIGVALLWLWARKPKATQQAPEQPVAAG